MIDQDKVAKICTEHGLQPRTDAFGTFWVHPDFEETLMINIDDNGNWEDGTPDQQHEFQRNLGTKFENSSINELDRYLTTMIEMLRLGEKPHQPG